MGVEQSACGPIGPWLWALGGPVISAAMMYPGFGNCATQTSGEPANAGAPGFGLVSQFLVKPLAPGSAYGTPARDQDILPWLALLDPSRADGSLSMSEDLMRLEGELLYPAGSYTYACPKPDKYCNMFPMLYLIPLDQPSVYSIILGPESLPVEPVKP